ncbi:MAG TPA: Rieske 2Fe-2S domain-containing protein, partial [Minicystis sp.]|nr:Rieske 2Fe-2S domain-containing protein [Minicystis sp.]
QLAAPGDFVTHAASGIPLLLTRSGTGLHAFVNICRHRSMKVERDVAGHARASFTCSLHGWTYDLEGRLTRPPDDAPLALLETGKLGLVELPVAEAFGLVWVVLDPKGALDPRAYVGALAPELDALDLGALRVAEAKPDLTLAYAWRQLVEVLLLCMRDAPVDAFGPHVRVGAVHGDPTTILLFPSTTLTLDAGEVRVNQFFPAAMGKTKQAHIRLVGPGSAGPCGPPTAARLNPAAREAFERALAAALEEA